MKTRTILLLAAALMVSLSACEQGSQAEPQAGAAAQTDPAVAAQAASVSLEDRIAHGKTLFATNCSACHQAEGQGLKGAFPPLAGSDYLAQDGGMVAVTAILNGLSGPITVNGVEYNAVMPPVSYLSDSEVADVVTFVLNSWGNQGGEIASAEVAAARGL